MLSILVLLLAFLIFAVVFGLRLAFHKKPLPSSCGGVGQCVCEDSKKEQCSVK